MSLLAAVLAALGAWLLVPPVRQLDVTARSALRLPRRPAWGMAMVAVVVVATTAAGSSAGLWSAMTAVLVSTAAHLVGSSLAERRRVRAADEIAHAMQVVAGLLRVGSVPSAALATAARDCACLERVAATQAIGGDVPRALQEAGALPGHEGLQSMGRAWELAERTGAPMASLTAQVSEQVRRDHDTHRVVQAELAGARASARLLAGLPLVGLLMGRIAGGDPVGFLVGSLPGQGCLLAGTTLACVGLVWTEHTARQVQEG